MNRFILSLDQGTSSSKAIVFDQDGRQVVLHQQEFTQLFPRQGWVEQNPMEIWSSMRSVMEKAVAEVADGPIVALGIANQRETALLWDRETGECMINAVVWQCRRSAPFVEKLRSEGMEKEIFIPSPDGEKRFPVKVSCKDGEVSVQAPDDPLIRVSIIW